MAGGSGTLVKIDVIRNSTKYQDILVQSLVASARGLRFGNRAFQKIMSHISTKKYLKKTTLMICNDQPSLGI